MKISVLLPTRNGGLLLADCLDSVLHEDDDRIEVVVSDNANTDTTSEILAERASDPRLRTIRHEKLLSVSENWNAAFQASTGDYLVLIGDDDYLLPGYFRRLRGLLDQHGWPECLTYSAFAFALPLTLDSGGYYAAPHFTMTADLLASPQLSGKQRAAVVAEMYRFRPRLPLNLQSTVFARAAAGRLHGGPFKPPFPDHYALNGMLMTASSWACSAERLLVIGISSKSFGHYFHAGEAELGLDYLGDEPPEFPGALPGDALVNAMHVWLLLLQHDFAEAAGYRVSRGDYLARQIWDWLRAWRLGSISLSTAVRRVSLLTPRDWALLARMVLDAEIRAKASPRLRLDRADRVQHARLGLRPVPATVRTHADFAAFVGGGDRA